MKPNAYTASATDEIKPFRMTLSDPTNIKRYLFGGFTKCLYEIQKFDVDTERRFAVILEDDGDVLKWFKPARGQFQIYYNKDSGLRTGFRRRSQEAAFSSASRSAPTKCRIPKSSPKKTPPWNGANTPPSTPRSTAAKNGSYLLIPHDAITANMTLDGLASRYGTA